MEDDVYRRGAFTEYFDALREVRECDYVAFDPTFVAFPAAGAGAELRHPKFLRLSQHNGAGFIVWYQRFFERFGTEAELVSNIGYTMDMSLTHSPHIVHCTPREQVVRQIVNKKSTTAGGGSQAEEYVLVF